MSCSRLASLLAPFVPWLALLLMLAVLWAILRALLGGGLGLKPVALVVLLVIVMGSVGTSSPVGASPQSCDDRPEFLYRLGNRWESRDRLDKLANQAKAAGFPHGVSTLSRSDQPDASRAPMAEVEALFPVVKTGRSPYHYTVVLPDPVTDEVTSKFNRLFGRTR